MNDWRRVFGWLPSSSSEKRHTIALEGVGRMIIRWQHAERLMDGGWPPTMPNLDSTLSLSPCDNDLQMDKSLRRAILRILKSNRWLKSAEKISSSVLRVRELHSRFVAATIMQIANLRGWERERESAQALREELACVCVFSAPKTSFVLILPNTRPLADHWPVVGDRSMNGTTTHRLKQRPSTRNHFVETWKKLSVSYQ